MTIVCRYGSHHSNNGAEIAYIEHMWGQECDVSNMPLVRNESLRLFPNMVRKGAKDMKEMPSVSR